MNELIQHKSWMQRNRIWFIPLIGLLIIISIAFFSLGLGGKVADISKAYADTALYENAIKEVEKSEKEIEEPKIDLSEQFSTSKIGDQLVLSDLTFIPGQHFLTESGDSAFVELLDLLNENSSLKINIEGHICCNINGEDGLDLATNRYNLSEARAEYIYTTLIENGIEKERLSYEGFARSKPIYPDELTEDEKKANRRVEIKILEK